MKLARILTAILGMVTGALWPFVSSSATDRSEHLATLLADIVQRGDVTELAVFTGGVVFRQKRGSLDFKKFLPADVIDATRGCTFKVLPNTDPTRPSTVGLIDVTCPNRPLKEGSCYDHGYGLSVRESPRGQNIVLFEEMNSWQPRCGPPPAPPAPSPPPPPRPKISMEAANARGARVRAVLAAAVSRDAKALANTVAPGILLVVRGEPTRAVPLNIANLAEAYARCARNGPMEVNDDSVVVPMKCEDAGRNSDAWLEFFFSADSIIKVAIDRPDGKFAPRAAQKAN